MSILLIYSLQLFKKTPTEVLLWSKFRDGINVLLIWLSVRKFMVDNLDGLDSVGQKTFKSGLRLPWRKRKVLSTDSSFLPCLWVLGWPSCLSAYGFQICLVGPFNHKSMSYNKFHNILLVLFLCFNFGTLNNLHGHMKGLN